MDARGWIAVGTHVHLESYVDPEEELRRCRALAVDRVTRHSWWRTAHSAINGWYLLALRRAAGWEVPSSW